MRFAVFGAGGVGGYFGGRLAGAGHDVVFIARGAHLAALRGDGLRVESIAGDFAVHPVQATDDPGAVDPVDAVLVCVKAWQVPGAARALHPLLHEKSLVLPLENGVEAADQLGAEVGRSRVLGGLCRILSYVAGPGRIRHAGVPARIDLGERDGQRSDRALGLAAALGQARGMTAVVSDDIEAAIWEKFLFIAPFGAVGALTGDDAGAMRAAPETRDLLRAATAEIYAVALARGVRLPEDAVTRTLAFVDGLPAAATASMQRDILEGRPSELESQTGTVVRLARALSVPAPVNESLYAALSSRERSARRTETRS